MPEQTSVPQSPIPAAPPPSRSSGFAPVLWTLVIVLVLGVVGYFAWASGLFETFIPASSQEEGQSETSDLEADLQSVDDGTDTEVENLEAQI